MPPNPVTVRICKCPGSPGIVPHSHPVGTCRYCENWLTNPKYRTTLGGASLASLRQRPCLCSGAVAVVAHNAPLGPCHYCQLWRDAAYRQQYGYSEPVPTLNIGKFCSLATSSKWQAWLYKFDAELGKSFFSRLAEARGCNGNATIMKAVIQEIDEKGGADQHIEFLRATYPDVVATAPPPRPKAIRRQRVRNPVIQPTAAPIPPPPEWPKRSRIALKEHFNGSIIEFDGKILLATRQNSTLWLTELDQDDFTKVKWSRFLPVAHEQCANGAEDPRLFVHRGKLHVSFAGLQVSPEAGKTRINQLYCELDADFQPLKVFAPNYKERQPREKNWCYFSHEGQLYAVYSVSPHVVLKIEGDDVVEVFITSNFIPWKGGHKRGGTPPLLVNGEYVSFTHGNLPVPQEGRTPDYHYSVGAYAFEASPPFRVTGQTIEPLLWAGPADKVRLRPDVSVVFPAGAILREGRWLVSAGVADVAVDLLDWPIEKIKLDCLDLLPPSLQMAIDKSAELPGWCPKDKAEELARLVLRHKPKVVVEVGVFGGRSFIPMALANKHGIAYAVDSWSKMAATEGRLEEWDKQWWEDRFDGPGLFRQFQQAMTDLDLWGRVHVLCMPSVRAVRAFADGEIDLLHIDGNHSPEASTRDVREWLPKVRSGGIIVVDDAERESLTDALAIVGKSCHPYWREYVSGDAGRWRVYVKF